MAAWDKDLDPTPAPAKASARPAWERDLDPTPAQAEAPSFGQMLKDEVANSLPGRAVRAIPDLAAGAVRGAGSIGATLLYPIDKITDIVKGDREQTLSTLGTGEKPLSRNEERRRDMTAALGSMGADTDSTAFAVGKIGGEIAGTAGAGGAIGNTLARVPGAATAMPGVINALRTGGMTTGQTVAPGAMNALRDLGTRAVGGAVTGGASAGLVDPEQAGWGAVAGGMLPIAMRSAGALGNAGGRVWRGLTEPFNQAGRERIIGRVINEAAGSRADDVLANLRQAGTPFVGPNLPGQARTSMGELVPGSLPTAGQAARNPGVAALERAASATNPEMTNTFAERIAQQNAARVDVLDDLAGTQGAREFFAANRAGTAQQLYDEAYAKGASLKQNPTTGQFRSKSEMAGIKGEITKLMDRPSVSEAMDSARRLAADEGVKLTDPAGSVKGLDYLKRALDDKISKATGNEQRVLVNLKNRVLTTIDNLSPSYAAARQTFQDMSRPINQMDTAQLIRDRAVNPRGNMTLNAFARNLSDDTAASATGFRKATLENTLEPAQMNRLSSLLEDLRRSDAAMNAGRGVGSDTVQKLSYTNMMSQFGVPNFVRGSTAAQTAGNLLSRGSDTIYGRANREIAAQLAEIMQDPALAARALEVARAGRAPGSNALAKLLARNPGLEQLGYQALPVGFASTGR